MKSITLAASHWQGHRQGQHVDMQITAEDSYQAERNYSITSASRQERYVTLIVERLTDGEVSPYRMSELHVGDQMELCGLLFAIFVAIEHRGGLP
ncbi:FAD-binding oxidoreductase [Dictyobacter formicarum]|uniref:FAD-binding FR-type domain-containing protein n=1 Tax=Dictyobacter formicarum TaxID=2778368 RepID=A0ABQ3VRB4_9CHLR|nr:FAD-binding oxidoreductase [Dictyobacter formicarum]GHO87661.1 hypothetical protein KSZ_56670 [Dictyobacter formicarum]